MKGYRPFFDRVWTVVSAVSVRTKIMGMILGLTLVLGFGVTLQVRFSMTRTLIQELEERAISIGRDLGARSTDPILIYDTFALYQLLRDTMANNPDLRYAFILDEAGQVLVHSFLQDESRPESAGFPSGLIEANRVAPHERYHQQLIETNEGLVHDFAVPILGGRAGTARIGLSETRLHETVNAVTRRLLFTTLAVAIAGVAAATFLTWLLTRPILELVSVTRAVAQGDLSRKAPRSAKDEIGTLGNAFNQMVDDLAIAQAESQAYNQELVRRNRELAALNAVARAVSSPPDLSQTMEKALRAVLEATGFQAGWVFVFREDGHRQPPICWIGLPDEVAQLEGFREPSPCLCNEAVECRQPRVISLDPERCPAMGIELGGGRCILCHATVPLVSRSAVLGVMNVASHDPEAFRPEDLKLLGAIGHQMGVAIENAQLWEEVRRKEDLRGELLKKVITAQEEERRRIARELHDETSQALTSLMVGLKVLEGADSFKEVHQHTMELRRIVAAALEDVRDLALELRPSVLDDMGLIPALERYTHDYSRKFDITVDFHTLGLDGTRLLPQVETALYRIVQEALINVARHARADTVSVLLERHASRLVVIVEDDGQGFDTERLLRSSPKEECLGLYGMQERVALVGGSLAIESSPGAGTTVFVEVPLHETTSEEKGRP